MYYILIYNYILIYVYIYIYQAHMHILKVNSTISKYVKCFIPGILSSKNFLKGIKNVNKNAPGRSTSYLQMKIKARYTIT